MVHRSIDPVHHLFNTKIIRLIQEIPVLHKAS
jgi:hypothetical protein